jgi:hypothetical protein
MLTLIQVFINPTLSMERPPLYGLPPLFATIDEFQDAAHVLKLHSPEVYLPARHQMDPSLQGFS